MKKLAIFDIDGTLFRSSLLIELVEALIHAGIFPARAHTVYARAFRKWLDRKGTYEAYITAVVKAHLAYIRGVPRRKFLDVAHEVIALHKNRTYRYTRDLVQKLAKKNYYLIAISNSPKEIVDAFCTTLGFDKVYGRIYQIDRYGKFTGSLLYKDLVADKSKLLHSAVLRFGATLKGSIGVGDTEADIPFLELVSRPICFNPNRKLYRHARARRWQVVIERKDMIYML